MSPPKNRRAAANKSGATFFMKSIGELRKAPPGELARERNPNWPGFLVIFFGAPSASIVSDSSSGSGNFPWSRLRASRARRATREAGLGKTGLPVTSTSPRPSGRAELKVEQATSSSVIGAPEVSIL
jgi:hypothetical protein